MLVGKLEVETDGPADEVLDGEMLGLCEGVCEGISEGD